MLHHSPPPNLHPSSKGYELHFLHIGIPNVMTVFVGTVLLKQRWRLKSLMSRVAYPSGAADPDPFAG